MMNEERLYSPAPPPFSSGAALRYARAASEEYTERATVAYSQLSDKLSYRALTLRLDVTLGEDTVDFGYGFLVKSRALARHLSGCCAAYLLCATVGLGVDRAIARAERLSAEEALFIDAVGTERIEALCDAVFQALLCDSVGRGETLTERFSPGYADFSLEHQKDIFRIMAPESKIGLTLGDGLLMSPRKSVSAVIGVKKK